MKFLKAILAISVKNFLHKIKKTDKLTSINYWNFQWTIRKWVLKIDIDSRNQEMSVYLVENGIPVYNPDNKLSYLHKNFNIPNFSSILF